jgi:hypothetical protein
VIVWLSKFDAVAAALFGSIQSEVRHGDKFITGSSITCEGRTSDSGDSLTANVTGKQIRERCEARLPPRLSSNSTIENATVFPA